VGLNSLAGSNCALLRFIWDKKCGIKAHKRVRRANLVDTGLPMPPETRSETPTGTAESSVSKVVAFDFDGTLTYTDSFTAFLKFTSGRLRIAAAFAAQPSLLGDYIATRDRGALKSRLLFSLLGEISKVELEQRIACFVATKGHGLFRPDAMTEWERQEQPNQIRVIVTASPQILVAPFGEMIGADRVIGTRLGFSTEGRLLPDLEGINCRGEEKMCRLREAFGPELDLEAAYGDTAGDREMLAAARHPYYRVFKRRP
jgi:phosphatidylglycerophosphatase C